jgi:hypothetical protein
MVRSSSAPPSSKPPLRVRRVPAELASRLGGKGLAPGRYRLLVTPRSATGKTGAVMVHAMRIVP